MASKTFGADTQILMKDGSSVAASTLDGKVLGIYFSAHWCPPCKMFTPQLSKWYSNFKANSPNADNFELVFVSSDRDEESYELYRNEMSFPALNFEAREVKAKLSEKFGVQGIPTLVVVDAEGKLITKKGRSIVSDDPQGENFPWTPKPFGEVIKGKLERSDGTVLSGSDAAAAIEGKVLGIYFSASWCGPCQMFTPQLIKVYNKVKAAGKDFEILFVSGDRLEAPHKEYFAKMPWLALPFKDKRAAALNDMFDVEGIPTLIIVGPDGKVINADGREALGDDDEGAEFPWTPKPIVQLTESSLGKLNTNAVLIHYTDNVDAAMAALTPVAEAEAAAAKEQDRDAVLFMVATDDEPGTLVRDFASLGDTPAMNVLLNIPGQNKYIHASGDLDVEAIKQIVAQHHEGSLEVKKIR
jgi:nucleoredoxin